MGRWVLVWACSGCNLATNAVLKSSDRGPVDSGTTGPTEATDVLITEVLSNGSVKFVELWNGTDDAIDLEGYELRRYANGGAEVDSALVLDGQTIEAGEFFVISGIPSSYELWFPDRPADLDGQNHVDGNGDDAYELAYVNGTGVEVVDIYGEILDDVTDIAWNYEDRSAQRREEVVVGRETWRSEEWEIEGLETGNPGER